MISICYITARQDPKLEWFLESLFPQIDETVELIVVDGLFETRPDWVYAWKIPLSKLDIDVYTKHIEPKPSVWSGRFRKTSKNYAAQSNYRNTAIASAKGDYLMFFDDCSVVLPGYWDIHKEAAEQGLVLEGMRSKAYEMIVQQGKIQSMSRRSHDFRKSMIDTDDFKPCQHNWLYGHCFSLPMEVALRVNGCDEFFDGEHGGEDCNFGSRIWNSGTQIYINKLAEIVESEEAHISPWIHPKPKELGGKYANDFIQSEITQRRETWTRGNNYNLRDLRAHILAGGDWPKAEEPLIDWRDGQPVSEM